MQCIVIREVPQPGIVIGVSKNVYGTRPHDIKPKQNGGVSQCCHLLTIPTEKTARTDPLL